MTFRTAALAGIFAAISFTAHSQAQERLALGATNSQSAHYAYFAALAQIINSTYPETYQASVVETGANPVNLITRMIGGDEMLTPILDPLYGAP